jgi:hypothetical protein
MLWLSDPSIHRPPVLQHPTSQPKLNTPMNLHSNSTLLATFPSRCNLPRSAGPNLVRQNLNTRGHQPLVTGHRLLATSD